MTALTANQSTLMRDGGQFVHGVKASATVYQGALLEANGNYVQAATKAASKSYVGIALEGATGGSADGDVEIEVRRRVAVKFKTVSGSVPGLGATAYCEDDQTGHDTSTGRSAVGTVVAVESDGVWVFVE